MLLVLGGACILAADVVGRCLTLPLAQAHITLVRLLRFISDVKLASRDQGEALVCLAVRCAVYRQCSILGRAPCPPSFNSDELLSPR